MTIHADFVKILKSECPDAFTETLAPHLRPDTVFIDGQVKLMKADEVKTWTVFLNVMFFKTIERCFSHGASVVVLGFDDYTYVPTSKTMTQVKRNKQVPVLTFGDKDHLPAYMPDDWSSAMRNRTFKVKVIHKILVETKAWFQEKVRLDHSWRARTLVLDFQHRPEVLFVAGRAPPAAADTSADDTEMLSATRETADAETPVAYLGRGGADLDACLPAPESDTWKGRGECDIKAFFWMRYSRRLLIVSTDGDYIPLSMLQMLPGQGASAPCDVFLFRMRTKTDADESPAAKRQCTSATKEEAKPPYKPGVAKKSSRQYEFVHVRALMACVDRLLPSRAQPAVAQFCTMVAWSGCDFAMNLPRLGPKTIWKLRHRLSNLDLSQPLQLLCAMSILYWDTFIMKNSIPAGMTNTAAFFAAITEHDVREHYKTIIRKIQSSKKVAPSVAGILWDIDRATAHTLNIEWTLAYWNRLHEFPDPHSRDYGYERDAKGRTHFSYAPAK